MRIIEIGVTYRRQVSDGNYGTEAAEVHMSGTLETDDDAGDQAANLLDAAKEVALEQLSSSLSANVRRAVALPKPTAKAVTVADDVQDYIERKVEEEELTF